MSDRLSQQIADIRKILQDTDDSLRVLLGALSEPASRLAQLMREEDPAPCRADLAVLKVELIASMLAATAKEPAFLSDKPRGDAALEELWGLFDEVNARAGIN